MKHLLISIKNLAQVAMDQKLMVKRRSKLNKKISRSKHFPISNQIAIVEAYFRHKKDIEGNFLV